METHSVTIAASLMREVRNWPVADQVVFSAFVDQLREDGPDAIGIGLVRARASVSVEYVEPAERPALF